MEFPKINSLPKCRFAHIFGDEKYLNLYRTLEDYCKKYFVDEKLHMHYLVDHLINHRWRGHGTACQFAGV